MRLSHAWDRGVAVFDEVNLVSGAGLVPVLELAEQTGLSELLDDHVRFTSEVVRSGAANPTPKLTSIIGGLLGGADSIGDLDVIRSGGTQRLFGGVYAPTTLGTLLREFTGGHVRQLQAVQRRHLLALAERTGVLDGIGERAFVDIDSLLRPVYGHAKQGASFGHTKIAGKHPAEDLALPAGRDRAGRRHPRMGPHRLLHHLRRSGQPPGRPGRRRNRSPAVFQRRRHPSDGRGLVRQGPAYGHAPRLHDGRRRPEPA